MQFLNEFYELQEFNNNFINLQNEHTSPPHFCEGTRNPTNCKSEIIDPIIRKQKYDLTLLRLEHIFFNQMILNSFWNLVILGSFIFILVVDPQEGDEGV